MNLEKWSDVQMNITYMYLLQVRGARGSLTFDISLSTLQYFSYILSESICKGLQVEKAFWQRYMLIPLKNHYSNRIILLAQPA